jgi:toxin ParE1/3/4
MPALPVVWRAVARGSLGTLIRYIAEHDPSAARRMKAIIEAAVLPLAEHPYLFRPGRVPGTREIVAHPN